jgi:hypothetical protein
MGPTLSSVAALTAEIAAARHVAFGAYVLGSGPVRAALVSAAQHGADVDVVLPRAPWPDPAGDVARTNAAAAGALRGAGAHVRWARPDPHTTFHLKAAVCDGVAYLDDRNWTRSGADLVVADHDRSAVRLVRDALRGHGGAIAGLATRKDAAQQLELELIASAGAAPVTVETETIGAGPLSAALAQHAASGAPTTLIVSAAEAAHERGLLAHLRSVGVDVRGGGTNAKLALVGARAWIGSANATFAGKDYGAQLDWGTVTADAPLVAAVRAALARDGGDAPATGARAAAGPAAAPARPASPAGDATRGAARRGTAPADRA